MLASYHNVRSYYLRVYEAKFILGAIAASLSETDEIGYIADYPIYGTPASINAFALGAQLVNPRAKIVLEWSTLPGHSPERRWPRAAYTSFPAATSARRIWNPARSACITSRTASSPTSPCRSGAGASSTRASSAASSPAHGTTRANTMPTAP
ncbi:MAG: BMP family ABC transporter substrate-binding protein [Christensenellales bacterium]